jgi:3-hydroxybutyryl-CoA dehydrogenase
VDIQKVFVAGAGQMGSGIAQIVAQTGFEVVLFDIEKNNLQKGLAHIKTNLQRQVAKGRITDDEMSAVILRIQTSSKLTDASEADIAIESIIEKKDIKQKLFRDLDDITRENIILASNTSSIPITEIAAVTKRPNRIIGMHFSNPVPVMKLVEIIRGLQTSDEVYENACNFVRNLNKAPVEVHDFPGFVTNRILIPMINEAIYTVYEGVAKPDDVDRVMTLGMNHPMGPLALADFIGLDTCLSIMETLYDGFRDSKYRPCPLLQKYVSAGWLGKKSGRGFYTYDKENVDLKTVCT